MVGIDERTIMKAEPIEQADDRRKAASGNMKCRTKQFCTFY